MILCLRKIYCYNDIIFLVDKDFYCIGSFWKTFRDAAVFLCVFHVIKFLETLIATPLETVEKKSSILDKFKLVLYTHNEEIYKDANKQFMKEISNVQVRVNHA